MARLRQYDRDSDFRVLGSIMKRRLAVLSLLALAACSDAESPADTPSTATSNEDRSAQAAQAVKAVAESAETATDESGDCGAIAGLLETLPASVDGMTTSYRGCESQVTAQVIFESDDKIITEAITVLDTSLAGVGDKGGDQWQEMVDETWAALEAVIGEQLGGPNPQVISMASGEKAVLFADDGGWTVLAISDSEFGIQLTLEDNTGTMTLEQARAALEPLVQALPASLSL